MSAHQEELRAQVPLAARPLHYIDGDALKRRSDMAAALIMLLARGEWEALKECEADLLVVLTDCKRRADDELYQRGVYNVAVTKTNKRGRRPKPKPTYGRLPKLSKAEELAFAEKQ